MEFTSKRSKVNEEIYDIQLVKCNEIKMGNMAHLTKIDGG